MKKSVEMCVMLFKMWKCEFEIDDQTGPQILKLLKDQKILKKNDQRLNLSLSWTC